MASSGADVTRVGFIGLGAMGFGMACNLLKKPQYRVQGYDVYPPSAEKFVAQGGLVGASPRDVAKSSSILVCMAANAQQIDDILFDHQTGALETLPEHATVLLCSTVPPTYHEALSDRIAQKGRGDVLVVDSPVSGGTKRAAEGTLTIFASGTSVALQRADQILHDMSEKLYIIPGGPGAGSKVKMVNQLLVGTHIAAASEAMGLAAKAGLNTREVYNIITNAAGNSWAFENRVPHMLDGDWTPLSALNIFVKDMGIVVSTARTLQFPLPLASTAEQLYISGAAQGLGLDDDAGLVRVFLPGSPNAVKEQAGQLNKQEKLTPSSTPLEISKIGMIGLGAMGQGMAGSLLRAGFPVHGYDVYEPAIDKFVAAGGKATKASSPSDAAKGADLLVLMVQNAAQADDALFGSGKAADVLPDGAIVILSSTVPPSFVRELESKLTNLGKGISLIDAPVSGGVVRAANGTLTIICSGNDAIISKVNAPLLAMTGTTSNLCHVQGGVGAASSVKLINQLLAGVHIAAAAEAMAFAARLGLDTRRVFDLLGNAAAWSWMFENRVPQMLDADWTPHSALAIFVKDLGIVLDEAKRLTYFAPISSAAHTLYLSGASHGWSKESDAGVVRLWELTGLSVSGNAGPKTQDGNNAATAASEAGQDEALPAHKTLDSLPAEYAGDVISSTQKVVNNGEVPVLVALDDDPTGTQTCNDIDVLTVWDAATLDYEFSLNPKGFFILTNSRALPSAEARQLILEICQNVKKAAEKAGKAFEIVLRGDSTLRGHLPEEPEAAEEALGKFDAWVITPFFYQGGRYTINDVHYVKEGDVLVPASHTPFAQDATFGYKNSNLRKYVLEKCGSRFDESSFLSVTLDDIRVGGPAGVAKKLLSAAPGSNTVVIVNAAAESDMHVFVAGLLEANKSGRRYLFRTGAAFVSSRLGITGIPPLTMADLGVSISGETKQPGGLIVAGSYVPKTTAQLKVLRERRGDKLAVIELDVAGLIGSEEAAEKVVTAAAAETTKKLSDGEDVLVMTSRELIKGSDALSSLQIGSKVARALVQLVERIDVRPRYLIAKGGITSSDAATKGLKMRRARILGQAAPGVPLWRCDEETSRHRGVPYVVFPGNVGSDQTLAEVVESCGRSTPPSGVQPIDEFFIKNAEELLARSEKLCAELDLLRSAVEKTAEKVNNHWHAYIPGFSTFWQSNTNQKLRAESLLQRSKEPIEDPEAEGPLHRDLRLLEGELSSYENHWSAIKKCRSVTWFRYAVPYRKKEGNGQGSVFVSAIVDNGHEWLRVLSTTERALLVQMAEADFPWDEPDDGDDDVELQEILGDEETQIEVLKCAQQLLAAARDIHGGYKHRIRIVLPNVQRGRELAIDRFLRGVQSLGDENVSLALECAGEIQTPPPPIETAIANLLDLGSADDSPPLTPTLNIDTSIFVALTTDISHSHGNQRKWRPKILEDVADEAEYGPRLVNSLYPILRGRTLVCTREAAETCLRMVYDASTDDEVARVEILLGQETLRGKQDDKMAFLERVLRQDGWPLESEDEAYTEARRKKLIAELQKLSCHPVPEDLQLPIRIVEDFRREHVREEVAKGTLPKVVLSVEPTLNETNCSSFMFGWRTGNTTITCNRHAVRRLGNLVRKLRWSRDAETAPILSLDWARGLAKIPFPGEVLVDGPGRTTAEVTA
ncbi:ketose-bisphosphate aldolase class-ii family protein [Colletotrichum karsti]|uniref:Ketose-bisphosphate aldolase class-ii family protein n=1 Tax=Colletotrichum karsti TaxID=1095194 RepID=A0A9P6LNT1_9PEZI|nr:ketose-bisphosphate aldolase class-ii family protein [Colletotrichum karsti]KAF9878867.1 ketose-bisphosphate aldolase class-ii family protein [Colletotrichum karsti]